ncbi:MAG: AI-2E family transporter [Acidobacteriota bacterium]
MQQDMPEAGSAVTGEKGSRFLLLVASVIVVVAGLKAASGLILPLLVSAFLALITLPLLSWLQSLKLPRALAVLITLLAALIVLAVLASFIGGSLAGFTGQLPKYRARLGIMSAGLADWLQARGLNISGEFRSHLFNPAQALDLVSATLRATAAVLSNLVLVLLTIAFILLEAAGCPAKLQAAFGGREIARRYERIQTEIQRYLGMKTLISLATGSLVSLMLALLGVDFPLLWGALAFILNYIPSLGSIIAALPPTLLAAIQLGPGSALAVALMFLAINLVLGSFLEPYLMGRRLGLSALVVFLSLIFWGWVWGPVGMLLSVPLTMVIRIMLENTEEFRWIAILLDASPSRSPEPARQNAAPAGRH